jgi:hypothetical protein
VLNDRLGQHPPPREVPQGGPLELAAVDADRRLRRHGGDLVGNRQDAVEPVLSCDVQVGVDLLGPQRGAGGLDLDQARPHLLPAAAHDRPVGDDRLALGVLEAHSANVSITGDLGAPSSLSSAWPNSGTARITASSDEVARFSCSSWPRIPAVGISRASGQPAVSNPEDPFCRDDAIRQP